MLSAIGDLLEEKRVLETLPEGRRVFWRGGLLSLEVDRATAMRLLEERLREAERALRDALEKIKAAYRALAERDEARFRALAAEVGLLTGVAPDDRHALQALEKAIEEQLARLDA
ncbi:hypothetical protein [Oceanithermus sp.]|uniref:hypothetical protein n=1 Tax=Oceanithermus sp. TaxID=2268145 RepID=UPI0025D739F2|nr:hypothetical protein [Oceanithermus sp.]